MRGHVLEDKNSGKRWIYVPQAHIQFDAIVADDRAVVAAFRTDVNQAVQGGFVPVADWLQITCRFVAEVEVPDHIVMYAVESERKRQQEVADIEDLYRPQPGVSLLDWLEGFEKMLSESQEEGAFQQRQQEDAHERAIALEIKALFKKYGGLS